MNSLHVGGWAFGWFLVFWLLVACVFCLVGCLSCWGFGFSGMPGHSSCFPSYKSYEAQMVILCGRFELR